jgi:chemotaxis protein MotB
MKRTVLLLAVVFAGCVTQGTYDALKAEHDKTLATLAERDKHIGDQDKHIGDLDQNVTDLKAAVAKEQAHAAELAAQITKLQADIAKVNQDLANTVKDRSSLKASIEEMKTALADAQKRKAAAEARVAEFRSMLARFKSLIDAGKLKVKIADGRMIVELATDVLFASGSANLSKEGKTAITEVARLLASIPGRSFQIEGHTDNVPIATAAFPSNWELAAWRALTVLHTMVDAGMPTNRISAASYADSKPAKPNDTPADKAANRRIEIVVVPDLSGLPGFDELNHAATSS